MDIMYNMIPSSEVSIGTLIALKACFMNNAKKAMAFYDKFGKQKH